MRYSKKNQVEDVFSEMEKQKTNILQQFDFEKMRKVMEFLNWYWYDTEGVPSVYDLIKKAEYLLTKVIDVKMDQFYRGQLQEFAMEYSCSTGGLKASANDRDLQLSFEVEDIRQQYMFE